MAASVADPEMPMLTLADLGVLRGVQEDHGRVTVTITPTYSGCPALATMRDDLVHALRGAGWADVEVRTVLDPAWSSDWITEHGRESLRAAGVSPPGERGPRAADSVAPVALSLLPVRRRVACPRCGASDTETLSEFGPTPCTAVLRCLACLEPFEHVKEI